MQRNEKNGYSQNDPIGTHRKIKKIQLDVWEDSEASFYLALARLKQPGEINANDVKSLLDSVYYPEAWQTDNYTLLQNKLLSSWEFIYKARKYEADYLRVSQESFSKFVQGNFGQALLNVFYHCANLQTLTSNEDDIKVKTDLSGLSLLIETFKNSELTVTSSQTTQKLILHPEKANSHSQTIEQLPNGLFRITDENLITSEMEFYIQQDEKLQRVFSFPDLQNTLDHPISYVHVVNRHFVIKMEKEGDDICSHYLIGARIKDDALNLTGVRDQFTIRQPMASVPFFDSEADAPYREVEYQVDTTIQIDPDVDKPIKINDEFEEFYKLPDSVSPDSYTRYQIVERIYHVVDKWFPELSFHVKCTVTGYLCIPFRLLDTEAEHDNSPRTSSYHAYVGKTVKNILNSKPG